jgi:replication factor A1
MVGLDDILARIEANSDMDKDEIRKKVESKRKELSGLISEEGAAHLVAKDMGVNLLNNEKRKIELKNILPGMRNVSAAGRVFNISKIVDFKKKNGSEGRVVNIFIGDKSGFVRLPLWNEQVKMVEENTINLGDIVQVTGALAKENIYGDVELSIGRYGKVFPVTEEAEGAGIEFPSVEELAVFLAPKSGRVPIKNLSPGQFEVRATILDVLKSRFLFNTCPKCGGKVSGFDDDFTCDDHGKVEPKPEMVVSFIVDDGTGMLRVVAFRDLAEKIGGVTAEELDKMTEEERHEKLIGSMVGKEYIFFGNVKKSRQFENMEMIANNIETLNVTEESERLANLLKLKLS